MKVHYNKPSSKKKTYSVSKSALKDKIQVMSDFCIIPTPAQLAYMKEAYSEIDLERRVHTIVDTALDADKYAHYMR